MQSPDCDSDESVEDPRRSTPQILEYRWGLKQSKPPSDPSTLHPPPDTPLFLISKRELAHLKKKGVLSGSVTLGTVHHLCEEYLKWSRKRCPPPLINRCAVGSLDSMLEIWTGLQLLTTSLAPIQEQRSTPFFHFLSGGRDPECFGPFFFSPADGKSCLWMNEDSTRWLGFVFAAQRPDGGDWTGSADTLRAEGFSQSGENL